PDTGCDPCHEAATEPPAADQGPHGLNPVSLMHPQEGRLAALERLAASISPGKAGPFTLDADELSAARVPVLVEAVGVDEARRVVLGALQDRSEERLVLRHDHLPRLPL